MNQYITIFIQICVIQKVYECRVSRYSTFSGIVEILKEMLLEDLDGYYKISQEFEIYEKFFHVPCDLHKDLNTLNVQNGMWFELY